MAIESAIASAFMTQYLSEVADAVAREKLAVDTVFAMHLAPTPWKEITNAILRAESHSTAPPNPSHNKAGN